MSKPRDWYQMDYHQQQEWEANERKHRQALDDAEDDARRFKEDAERAELHARRERNALREELSIMEEDAGTTRAAAASMENFLKQSGQWDAYVAWKGED